MSDFYIAFHKTMGHEGGYSNNPLDSGGETYRGIARKHWPDWAGWETIDEMKAAGWIKNNRVEYISAAYEITLAHLVEKFYRTYFWDALRLGELKHGDVAAKVFDIAVNTGPRVAVRFLQRALFYTTGDEILIDGVLGALTIHYVNRLNGTQARTVETLMRVQLGQHYMNIVDNKPSQRAFINGWAARVFG